MPSEVSQDNLHLFIAGKAAGVAVLIAQERGISPADALVAFYATPTYRHLEKAATKYWHYSSEQLYQLLREDAEA